MADQVYMTAKLNLSNGTIVYPQVSLDNVVASISDPTLVSVATKGSNGKVPVGQLPITATVTASETTVPTAGAVYTALGTKQATLVEGDNIIHIIGGSTIMADITNLDVAGIDQTATNGVHLVLDGGNTISAVAALAANDSAGVIAGATNGVKLVDGVAQFDNDTVDAATPADITGGVVNKVIQADDLELALRCGAVTYPMKDLRRNLGGPWGNAVVYDEANDYVQVSGTVASWTTNAGAAFTQPLPYISEYKRKWLITAEVYNNMGNSSYIVGDNGFPVPLVTVSGVPANTSTTGSWVKLGKVCDTTTTLYTSYVRFYAGSATAGTSVDFRIRNIQFIDVTGLTNEQIATVFNNPGFLYESGPGVSIRGKEIGVDEATPADTFAGVDDKTVTPNSLKSTLSVGQAVDCTSEPKTTFETVLDISGDTPVAAELSDVYRGTFRLQTASTGTQLLGFTTGKFYPKAAETEDGTPLKYLFLCDVTNNGSSAVTIGAMVSTGKSTADVDPRLDANKDRWYSDGIAILPQATLRIAMVFTAKIVNGVSSTTAYIAPDPGSGNTADITISHLRQFEIMALTDDAIKYLADIPDPDKTDDLYMIKTDMVSPWTNIIDMQQATAVTVASGLAYKSTILSGGTCTFSTDTVPAGTYGRDAHLTLFLDVSASVTFQSPLILMDALTPGAGHNMTIKFRDGQALAYVDDTDIGYVVTVTSGSGDGSLYKALTTDNEYITFSHTLDGSPITMPSTTTITYNGTMNVIGNGIGLTIVDTPILANQTVSASKVVLYGVESTKPFVTAKSYVINNCYFHDTNLQYQPTSSTAYLAAQVSCVAASSITGSTFTRLSVDTTYDIIQNYAYVVDDVCIYGRSSTFYICIQDCTGEEAGTYQNTEYFKQAPHYFSDYRTTREYVVDDVVRDSGSFYICLQHIPANSNIPLSNTDYWKPANRYVYGHSYGDVYVANGSNSVSNCVFDSCGAYALGGAPALISNCRFINNTNGFYQGNWDTALNNCVFSGNTEGALSGAPTGKKTEITDCTFATASDRVTVGSGTVSFAGLNILGSTVRCSYDTNFVFVSGTTLYSPDKNGVIDFNGKAVDSINITAGTLLDGITLKGRTETSARYIYMYNNTELRNCTITNMESNTYNGKGITIASSVTGEVRFTNVTMTNNHGRLGALFSGVSQATIVLNNCLIRDNTAPQAASYTGQNVYMEGFKEFDIIGSTVGQPTSDHWEGSYDIVLNGDYLYIKNSEIGAIGFRAPTNMCTVLDNVVCNWRWGYYAPDSKNNYTALLAGSTVTFGFTTDSTYPDATQLKIFGYPMFVGTRDEHGNMLVGGTATVKLADNSTVSVSGVGTHVDCAGGTDLQAPYSISAATGTGTGTLDGFLESSEATYGVQSYDITGATATLTNAVTDRVMDVLSPTGCPLFGGTVSIAAGATIETHIEKDANGVIDNAGQSTTVTGGSVTFGDGHVIGTFTADSKITVNKLVNGGTVVAAGGIEVGSFLYKGIVDLGGSTNGINSTGTSVSLAGFTVTNFVGSTMSNSAIYVVNYPTEANQRTLSISNVMITGNTNNATNGYSCAHISGYNVAMTDCVITGNTGTYNGMRFRPGDSESSTWGNVTLTRVQMQDADAKILIFGGTLTLAGTYNNAYGQVMAYQGCKIVIASGTIITLRDKISANVTGNIEVATGGCTVNGVSIAAGNYTSITKSGNTVVTA